MLPTFAGMRTYNSPGMPRAGSNRYQPRNRAWLKITLALLVVATLVSASCSDTDNSACPEGTDLFVKYELFMGRSGPDGEVVDNQSWDAFLADTVTPRFPDGLTVLDARGQWRNSEGQILTERAKLLVILAPPGEEPRGLIDEVSDGYKHRFNQESVLEVESDTCVSFS